MYFSSWRICGLLWLFRYLLSSSGMIPSNLPPYLLPRGPLRQVNVMCWSPVPHSQRDCSWGSSSSQAVSSIVPGSSPRLRSIVSATP